MGVSYTTDPVMDPKNPRSDGPSVRAQTAAQFDEYLSGLAEGVTGVYEIEDGDKTLTIRNRLKSAGQRAGVIIITKARGNTVMFKSNGPAEPVEVNIPRRKRSKQPAAQAA